MHIATSVSVLVAQLLVFTTVLAAESQDLLELVAMFDADQALRAPENRQNVRTSGAQPVELERDRRIAVFSLIATNQLQTANDYFRAAFILHHTSLIRQYDEERSVSLGAENHLLAFFLFRRAHELGHDSARSRMAGTYNHYLKACGEDWESYGYKLVDREWVWRSSMSGADSESVKCGFDPRPYLAALN